MPLGLTRYNTDARLTAVTPEFCRTTIETVKEIQSKRCSIDLVPGSPSWATRSIFSAGSTVPGRKHYGDYPADRGWHRHGAHVL